jgi:hypothetical protein
VQCSVFRKSVSPFITPIDIECKAAENPRSRILLLFLRRSATTTLFLWVSFASSSYGMLSFLPTSLTSLWLSTHLTLCTVFLYVTFFADCVCVCVLQIRIFHHHHHPPPFLSLCYCYLSLRSKSPSRIASTEIKKRERETTHARHDTR